MMTTHTDPAARPLPTWPGRVLRFAPIRILLAILAIGGAANAMRALLGALHPALGLGPMRQETLWYAVPVVISAHLAYLAYVRLVERRAATELSSAGAARETGTGVALGAGLFAATIGLIAALGHYQVVAVNPWSAMAAPLAMAVASGYTEELIFRGVFFRITEEALGSWAALALSSAFFGLMHMANPAATPFGIAAIVLEAGVMLGAAYLFTRRLWLAIGIHFAWNFVQAGVFGVRVSGYDMGGLVRAELSGPTLLTGGALGAEGSVFAVVLCLAAAAFLLRGAIRRGHVVPPPWRRGARR